MSLSAFPRVRLALRSQSQSEPHQSPVADGVPPSAFLDLPSIVQGAALRLSNYESPSFPAFAAHASLYILNAGVPVRIAKMCLAEPATTLLAVLSGRNHARLTPERNALAEYRARLTFFLRFWSADVIAETQTLLTLLRGDRVEGCPPLLNVLAFAVWTDDPALRVLRKYQDFREFFFAGATEKIVSGHDFLPVEKALLKRILAVRPDSVNCSFSKT